MSVPGEIAYADLALKPGGPKELSGIDQMPEIVGAAAVETVVARMLRNEFGLPDHPRMINIRGCWVEGATAPQPK